MAEVIRRAHRCSDELRGSWPHHGDIVRCSCGKWWRGYEPGNPAYAAWRRAWIRQLIFGRRT